MSGGLVGIRWLMGSGLRLWCTGTIIQCPGSRASRLTVRPEAAVCSGLAQGQSGLCIRFRKHHKTHRGAREPINNFRQTAFVDKLRCCCGLKPARLALPLLGPIVRLLLNAKQDDLHLAKSRSLGEPLFVMVAANRPLTNDVADQAGFFVRFLA